MSENQDRYATSGFGSVVDIRIEAARSDGISLAMRSAEKRQPAAMLIAILRQRYLTAADSAFAAGGASLAAEVTTLFDTWGIDVNRGNDIIAKAADIWRGRLGDAKAELDRLANSFSRTASLTPAWLAGGGLIGAMAGFLLGWASRAAGIFSILVPVEGSENVFEADGRSWYNPISIWNGMVQLGEDAYHYFRPSPEIAASPTHQVIDHPLASVIVPLCIIAALAIIGCWAGWRLDRRHGRRMLIRFGDKFMGQAEVILRNAWETGEKLFVDDINSRIAVMKG